jgi:hypothetical protein
MNPKPIKEVNSNKPLQTSLKLNLKKSEALDIKLPLFPETPLILYCLA